MDGRGMNNLIAGYSPGQASGCHKKLQRKNLVPFVPLDQEVEYSCEWKLERKLTSEKLTPK